MSSQYKENNFSTGSLSTPLATDQNNIIRSRKPNIDNLIKRIIVERRQEKKNIITLGVVVFSLILIFYFFQG
tara:strand:- start:104 stop:319 length:216 start_codon:yes stop_codon:yes gene_type:complete